MGIIGVNVFSGSLRYRCGTYKLDPKVTAVPNKVYPASDVNFASPDPVGTDPTWADTPCSGKKAEKAVWTMNTTATELISYNLSGDGMGLVCPNPSDVEGYKPGMVCHNFEKNPNDGVTGFDTILQAWLTIFQCITLEGWVDVTYLMEDANGPLVWIYFIFLILLGGFFLVNLFLAVLYLYFTQQGEKADKKVSETKPKAASMQRQRVATRRCACRAPRRAHMRRGPVTLTHGNMWRVWPMFYIGHTIVHRLY